MLSLFNERVDAIPVVFIDTETTGVRPGVDRAVQVGIARFERGALVASGVNLVDPGIPIPPEATAIHGITDERIHVQRAPAIKDLFAGPRVAELLNGAQPAAYNAPFDRYFVPPFGDDWSWPWLDCLSLVRVVDRYVRGQGRHRLETACQRWNIPLPKAHDAEQDAIAAGRLFFRLLQEANHGATLGELIKWQREQEAAEWFRFCEWKLRQPPTGAGNV
jgi:DNA polymerase-3 subunit epsilon